MPILIDMRNDQGRSSKNRLQVTTEIQDSALRDYEAKRSRDKEDRVREILEKYPNLRGFEII